MMTGAGRVSGVGPVAPIGDIWGDAWNSVQSVAGPALKVLNILAMPLINFNTSLLMGKNPIDALKQDLANFQRAGNLAEAIKSGDYKKVWSVATNNGHIFDKDLPAPAGASYDSNAVAAANATSTDYPTILAWEIQLSDAGVLPKTIGQQDRVILAQITAENVIKAVRAQPVAYTGPTGTQLLHQALAHQAADRALAPAPASHASTAVVVGVVGTVLAAGGAAAWWAFGRRRRRR
ncbi:MAG: hypothetical protein ACHQC8_06540 [Solirubrobacterales bacterium]